MHVNMIEVSIGKTLSIKKLTATAKITGGLR